MTALPNPATVIPADLTSIPQWVTWDYERRGDKRTKVPHDPKTGERADSTDPATWGTYEQALTDQAWSHRAGIGFVFSASDPFFFIDLDSAFDLDVLHPWAVAIADTFGEDCYCEVSPSGSGLHLIGRGTLPKGGNRKGQIEVYDRERFATITGNVWGGYATIGADLTATLTAWHTELFRPVIEAGTAIEPAAPPPPMTDDEILHRALHARNGDKLRRILSGDTSDYGSASEADAAAAASLKFWTQDADQIRRILEASGLQRPKWDEHRTYLTRTVENALALPGETYSAPNNIVDIRKHLGGGEGGKPDAPSIGFRLSDLGNGQRLAKRITGRAHYCHPAKRWYVFDGQRWNADDRGWLLTWAKESVLSMYDVVSSLPDKERTELIKHAIKSESERSLKAAIALATSEDGIPILPEAFDRDPMLLNVENGTIDLTTGDLRPHNPGDMLSKLAPVTFDPGAACPRWLAFLEQIFEGNAEQIAYVQKAMGYCLTGKTTERAVFFLWGAGKNGKSTLLTVVANILGEYHQKTPTETIMARRNDGGIPNDIAALKGARLVTASETEEGRRLNVSKVKDMSGNEELTARFLHGEFFKFRPQFKLVIATNHKPIIPGNDRAMFDRMKLIPFLFRIPEDAMDKELEAKLMQESAGILNWLIAGCLAWQEHGLTPPAEVVQATEQYRLEMDQIGAFIADRCILGPEYKVATGDLYAAYKAWCDASEERPLTKNAFGRQMNDREFENDHDGPQRLRTWFGIGLLDDKQGGERNYSVQNGISDKVLHAISREGENPGKSVQMRSPQNSVHPSRGKESEDDGWQ